MAISDTNVSYGGMEEEIKCCFEGRHRRYETILCVFQSNFLQTVQSILDNYFSLIRETGAEEELFVSADFYANIIICPCVSRISTTRTRSQSRLL